MFSKNVFQKSNALIRLWRPHQYYKNLIVFIPLLFSGHLFDVDYLSLSLLAFVIMCLASSSIYSFNDYLDVEFDTNHPTKKSRPLASGALPRSFGLMSFIVLSLLSISLTYFYIKQTLFVLGTFYLVSLLYSLYIKHLFLVDILTIPINFVLRAIVGAVSLQVPLSVWLFLVIYLLGLYLVASKRYIESSSLNSTRKTLPSYMVLSKDLLLIILSSVLFSYMLYLVEKRFFFLLLAFPIVLYLMVYHYWLMVSGKASEEFFNFLKRPNVLVSGALIFIMLLIQLYFGNSFNIVEVVLWG